MSDLERYSRQMLLSEIGREGQERLLSSTVAIIGCGSYLTSLCGREAVQVNVRGEARVSFPDLAERLNPVGPVTFNDYMLRFRIDSYELTVFPDGRAIVKGTTDEAVARSLYARYVGL